MFPVFSFFGIVSLASQPLLLALGVLAALATAERLAAKVRARADSIHTAALLAGAALWLGPRLLLVARGWRDYRHHPAWLLGLLSVRDDRLFYAGAAFALLVGTLYLLVRRVALAAASACLLPALALLLAFVHAGYFSVGAEPGRAATTRWGLVSTNRAAHALYGTPLGVPLLPVAAWACVGYALIALATVWLAARGRAASGVMLLLSGLLTVLLGQAGLHWRGQPMLLGAFTWAQTAGALSALLGSGLLLARR